MKMVLRHIFHLLIFLSLEGFFIKPSHAEPTVAQPLTYLPATTATVGTTSGVLALAGVYTRVLNVCTLPSSTTNVWLNPAGGTAIVGGGLPVYAGGWCVNFGSVALPIPTATITAITDGTSAQTVTMSGG